MIWVIYCILAFLGVFFFLKTISIIGAKKIFYFLKWFFFIIIIIILFYLAVRVSSFFLIFILPLFYFLLKTIIGVLVSNILRKLLNNRFSSSYTSKNNEEKSKGTSSFETAFVSMFLSHEDGSVTGYIKKGSFSGRRLEEMSVDDLIKLRSELKDVDKDTKDLIEAYLDRVSDKDWRKSDSYNQYSDQSDLSSAMSIKEAYLILGLDNKATKEQIKDAHRRLMVKIHPDQGGSNFLASKINLAKELLLKNL